MRHFMQKLFNEFHDMIEVFWLSFIKAPAALMAGWFMFSMALNPAHVAARSMQIARSGSMPEDMMTGIVTAWFLAGCAVFALSLVIRVVSKGTASEDAKEKLEGQFEQRDGSFYFHP